MAIFARMEKEFEDYWKKHRASLLLAAPKDLQEERNRSEKLNTFGDWLLYLAPIVVMVAFLDSSDRPSGSTPRPLRARRSRWP